MNTAHIIGVEPVDFAQVHREHLQAAGHAYEWDERTCTVGTVWTPGIGFGARPDCVRHYLKLRILALEIIQRRLQEKRRAELVALIGGDGAVRVATGMAPGDLVGAALRIQAELDRRLEA